MGYLDTQHGEICPRCIEKRRSGILEIRTGKFGAFLGCTKFPLCTYTQTIGINLENKATQLLKQKRKKTRRARRKSKRAKMEKIIAIKQKKQRSEMFANFKRLISE